jgi:hypothetical protein
MLFNAAVITTTPKIIIILNSGITTRLVIKNSPEIDESNKYLAVVFLIVLQMKR